MTLPQIRSMWTYPWDVLDLGADTVITELTNAANLNSISLALSYHAGRFVQVRSPKRKVYFPEDGCLYYPVDTAAYQGAYIQPQTVSFVDDCDTLLRRLEQEREKSGLRLSAWFVCLHNSRIGTAYPEATVVNAFGDRYIHSLCPSNPVNQTYLTTALRDLTYHYAMDAVELESPCFMGFPHEYHHEKDLLPLTPVEEFLMSLCFCDHCQQGAKAQGVDIERVHNEVKSQLEAAFNRATPLPSDREFQRKGIAYFEQWPELYAFLRWRMTVVTSLLSELKKAVHPRTEVLVLSPPPKAAWSSGIDVEAAGEVTDGVLIPCYGLSSDAVSSVIREARALVRKPKRVLVGYRAFPGDVTDGAGLQERVQAAVAEGAEGVNFYNYGLIPASRLEWIAEATKSEGESSHGN